MGDHVQKLQLEDVLDEKQVDCIVERYLEDDKSWVLVQSEVRPAVDGIAGFVGEHLRVRLHLEVGNTRKEVHLFVKRVPKNNKPKVDYIEEHHCFRREGLMLRILDEMSKEGSNPWCCRAYVCTDTLIVMPDLMHDGYKCRHYLDTLDTQHIYVATTSIARFHAAFVNYETNKSNALKRPYNTYEEFTQIMEEPTFRDSAFLRTSSKLSADLIKHFSTKDYANTPDIEEKLIELHIKACDSLIYYKDSVNVLIHKDLWVNNMLFKYENEVPINAILVDYQNMRYGPPAFDLMMFLYLTTDRKFRNERELDVLEHYFSTFMKHLSDDSKRRLHHLGYDKDNFLNWCERGRMFGLIGAIIVTPFALMDPKTAQEGFDNPETWDKYIFEDRSEPVLAIANKCEQYKLRNLEISEEFVERYMLELTL